MSLLALVREASKSHYHRWRIRTNIIRMISSPHRSVLSPSLWPYFTAGNHSVTSLSSFLLLLQTGGKQGLEACWIEKLKLFFFFLMWCVEEKSQFLFGGEEEVK